MPGPSASKSGKSREKSGKSQKRQKRDTKGRTSPDRETPPFEPPLNHANETMQKMSVRVALPADSRCERQVYFVLNVVVKPCRKCQRVMFKQLKKDCAASGTFRGNFCILLGLTILDAQIGKLQNRNCSNFQSVRESCDLKSLRKIAAESPLNLSEVASKSHPKSQRF